MKSMLFAVLLLCPTSFVSASLVTISHPNSVISGGGYGSSSTTYFYAPTDYEHSREVRNRSLIKNQINWSLTMLDGTAELNLSANAYSTYIPASSGVDRFGNPYFDPAYYSDSNLSGSFPITLDRGLNVTVSLGGQGLRGLGSFSFSYFNRVATYQSDPSAGTLSSATSFMPLIGTVDPLDVADLHESFWAPAGVHPFSFTVQTTHIEGQPFLDGEVLLRVSFSEIPEPRTAALCGMAVAGMRRRKLCNRR